MYYMELFHYFTHFKAYSEQLNIDLKIKAFEVFHWLTNPSIENKFNNRHVTNNCGLAYKKIQF